MIPMTRAVLRSLLRALSLTGLLALAACDGTAIATLTATPAQTHFLTYRVRLVSVSLQNSNGSKTASLLPSATSVDLAKLVNVDEIFGSAGLKTGNYTTVTIAVDFTNAVIVADDGTANGVTLKPLGANGQALGQVSLTLGLDSANQLSITKNQASALALNFNLAASNAVNLSAGTVTVTPMILASALPIDSNPVRIRGTLAGSSESTNDSVTSLVYTANITPFDGLTGESGSLQVNPNGVTTYEINGTASTGAIGQTQFHPLASGTWTVAYGSFNSSSTATTTTTTSTGTTTTTTGTTTGSTSSTDVSFAATEVLAGSSVQGSGSDLITGVVTAINGMTLTIPSATLITSAGSESYVDGTTTVTLSSATAVTLPAQSTSSVTNTIAQISVGSLVNVFGTATVTGSGNVTMDATAGRVRLDTTSAWGTLAVIPAENVDTASGVTAASTGSLTIDLTDLGGRAVAPFDFVGTGGSGGVNSNPNAYVLSTPALNLDNLTIVGQPVEVTGLVAPFGSAGSTNAGIVTPDFVATTLLDPTTIPAELVVDWGGGTPTPFNSLSSTEIDLLRNNSTIGMQHTIQVGPQSIDFTLLPSDPLIEPSTSTTSVVYAIGHTSTSTIDNFNTFASFISALQADLNGTTLATGMTVTGVYTATSYTLTATNVTVYLTI